MISAAGEDRVREQRLNRPEQAVDQPLRLHPGVPALAVPKQFLVVVGLVRGVQNRLLCLAFENRTSPCATSSQLVVKRVRDLDLAALAQRPGVPASAPRYYEGKGRIPCNGRRGR